MMSRGRLSAMPRAARCLAAVLVVVVGYGAETATAQDLAEYYRQLWFRENAERILERRGMRVEQMDADHLVSDCDSIGWKLALAPLVERRPDKVTPIDVS